MMRILGATLAGLALLALSSPRASAASPEVQGCTAAQWQQHTDAWPEGYTPETPFSQVFADAFPDMTLLQVLTQGGTGLNALGQQAVAALLNAAHPEVGFGMRAQEVIEAFNGAFASKNFNEARSKFEGTNARGCPLGK